MALCSRCIAPLADDVWWCPFCGRRAEAAPSGSPRRAPTRFPAPVAQVPPYQGPAAHAAAPYRFATRPAVEDEARARYRRRATRHRLSAVLGAVVGVTLVVAAVTAALHRPAPVVVHLGNEHGAGEPGLPTVAVAIGTGDPVSVDLDTGSVGLRVFEDTLSFGRRSGVTRTRRAVSAEFADGERVSGVIAYATVRIGSVHTTTRIPIELVTRATCVAGRPRCPARHGMAGLEATGSAGIMGVGLAGPDSSDPTDNPLLRLPSPYRASWSIALARGDGPGGRLVLGATAPPAARRVIQFQLRSGGIAPDGTPAWDDLVFTCWRIGPTRPPCGPTIFDTGSSSAVAQGVTLHHSHATASGNEFHSVGTGLPVSVTGLPGAPPFWSFVTGSRMGVDALTTTPGRRVLFSTGMQMFRSLTVTYDVTDGTVAVSRDG